ncbi:hypothetical protein ACIBG5_10785 [Kribbella sp. NPDC050241]|uniref:hypothetical protein n=1 Tax=Kribbella sp. NPDC050241 TaxID=3364115 RepID=UPI00379312F9
MPARVWSADHAQRAADRADHDHWELKYPLLAAAGLQIQAVRQRLIAEAADGNLEAFESLGDIRDLDQDTVARIVSDIAAKVQTQVDEWRRVEFGMGGHDVGRSLTILNVWHPNEANWEVLFELLASSPLGDYLYRALHVLALKAADLPDEVAERLVPLAEAIANRPDPPTRLFAPNDARPTARRLIAAINA